MDSDFWTSRIAAAKRQYTLQHQHQSSHFDEFEVEDEVRPDFPCPYCYEDIDIGSLCSHLEDEHPCESKVAVCPVCSRRRRLRKIGIPNNQASLRETYLQVLLGGSGGGRGGSGGRGGGRGLNGSNAATDPFLSSYLLNFPASEDEEVSISSLKSNEETALELDTPSHIWKSSFDPSLSYEEREKRIRQAFGRSVFVQDLLLSTLLNE